MTLEYLKKLLVDRGYNDAIIFEEPDYITAVVGFSEDGRVIYSYDQMVEYVVEEYNKSYEDAYDFISYTTQGALEGMGDKGPIIMHDIDE